MGHSCNHIIKQLIGPNLGINALIYGDTQCNKDDF